MKKLYLSGLGFILLMCFQLSAQNPQNAVTVAGSTSPGLGANQLFRPKGIFVDASGNLYIADNVNNRVQKYAPGAAAGVTVAPLTSGLTFKPSDVFVDASGNLYVADVTGIRILKYPADGSEGKAIIKSSSSGGIFFPPQGIFVDKASTVYLADGVQPDIFEFLAKDTVNVYGALYQWPSVFSDVFLDTAGIVYAADTNLNRVIKRKSAPGSTTGDVIAGGNGPGSYPNQLNVPKGIYVDVAGNLYVSDYNNNRIQKFTPGANYGVTVAGGNGPGTGPNQLNHPWGVEVDKDGNIYVSDYGNSRVQKFAPNGLTYKYFEGSWASLPNFNNILPVKTGITSNTDISVRTAGTDDNFAFLWEGYIRITVPGTYTFETVSDDGSRLYFNTKYNATTVPLVNNDGLHAPTSATGNVYIAQAGLYPIAISYFEKDGGQQMQAYWTGPGIERQLIPDAVFTQQLPTAPPSVATTGSLTYKYYEGGFNLLPDFSTLTPVKTGTSSNFDINVHRTGVTDSFAIVWDGFINIPTAGTYTFETISDDGSKLYFNNALVVNNDSTHPPKSAYGTVDVPVAGRYPIKVAYFENYGAESFQVYWTGPGFSRQQIPDPAFIGDSSSQIPTKGLNYKYVEGDFNLLPDFNALTPLRTGYTSNVDIGIRNPGVDDHFAFMWQGYINLPAAGTYTFETVSDDGSKLYFNQPYLANGNSLIDNDGLHPATSVTGTITVAVAGAYPITVVYFEKDGGQNMQLYWSGPNIARQLIPDAVFTPTGTTPINTDGLGYKYFEGDFDVLPDFSKLTPVQSGVSSNIDISVRPTGHDDHFAFLWQGFIKIPAAGVYTFELVSDDGSKLYFNRQYDPSAVPTVNNDGLHGPGSATGSVTLIAAIWYPIAISYFEKDGGESIQLYWSGPGFSRQLVPNSVLSRNPYGSPLATASNLNNVTAGGISKEASPTARMYPNPFSESFNIDFYNTSAANNVQVGIYDLKGKLLYMKNAGSMPAGNTTLQVKPDGKLLPGGVYVARLQINGLPSKIMKLVKIK